MRRSILLLALMLVALLGAMAATPLLTGVPALRPHSTPGEFDARRAAARLAFILGDQRPHPADTAAGDLVRGRLVALLRDMGLHPLVRDQLACNELYKQRGVSCARVRNVIAVAGPRAGKALLLNAHYDSTPVGPGAADDGIGVATLLEVAAILQDRPIKRPVILLFNEGEELGLIGARAFLADPLSRNVDSLINLEARGVRGPVNMFETSRPNAAAIAVFAAAVKRPVANSLSTDVYRLMPNYTDVNSLSERDWLTLNLAPIGNETRYHSPGDDVAALDTRTLQHMGDQTLALAQALANRLPGPSTGERIFMDLGGRALISLPLAIGVGLLIGLLIAFAAVSWRRRDMALGLAAAVTTVGASATLAWLVVTLLELLRPGMFWRAHPAWTHLATYACAALGGVLVLRLLARRLTLGQLRATFWLFYLAVGGLIGILAPGGIVFFLFPPLLLLVGVMAARWSPRAERIAAIAAIVLLYLTWGAMLGLLEELLNGGPMWLFAPLGTLIILPALVEAKATIDEVPTRTAAAIAAALVAAACIGVAAAPAYSADRQQRFNIQHVTDAALRKAYWSVTNDGAPLPSAYRAAAQWRWATLPYSERQRWIAAAPPLPNLRPPDLQLVSAMKNGTERTLTLRLRANGAEHVLLIAPDDARIRFAGVAGFVRPIDPQESGKYAIDCFGRSCDGLSLIAVIGRTAPVGFTVIGSRPGLPPSATLLLAARPRYARPQYSRDEMIIFARRKL